MRLSTEYCYVCKEQTTHFNGNCGECSMKKEREKREKLQAERTALTLEGRVRKIEEWIDNINKNPPWETQVDG